MSRLKRFDRFPHTGVFDDLNRLRTKLSRYTKFSFGSSGEGELTIKGPERTVYARKFKKKDGWKIVVCRGTKELKTLFPDSSKEALDIVLSELR